MIVRYVVTNVYKVGNETADSEPAGWELFTDTGGDTGERLVHIRAVMEWRAIRFLLEDGNRARRARLINFWG